MAETEELILFGGYSETDEKQHCFYNDVYIFEIASSTWRKEIYEPGHFIPVARAGHSLNKLNKEELVCFGGGNSQTMFDDLLVYNLALHSWFDRPADGVGPCARAGHSFS